MITALAILCILLMVAVQFLNLMGLPANWIALGFAVLWAVFVPETPLTFGVIGGLAVLAVIGEIFETLMGYFFGKRYGGSTLGAVVSIICALVGAILCAPILFGIGALFGALGGAFLGSLIVELCRGQHHNDALRAAWGSMLGRFSGTIVKIAIGCAMVVIAAPYIWNS